MVSSRQGVPFVNQGLHEGIEGVVEAFNGGHRGKVIPDYKE